MPKCGKGKGRTRDNWHAISSNRARLRGDKLRGSPAVAPGGTPVGSSLRVSFNAHTPALHPRDVTDD